MKKILVVDDDRLIVEVIKKTLKAEEREFIAAYDGVEAVEKVFSEMPDLVILDVMMPKMNGYQVCRFLKNDKHTWGIPILILTAKEKVRDRQYGLSIGADGYLVKPFQSKDLREGVDKLLGKPGRKEAIAPDESLGEVSETTLLSKVSTLLDSKLQEMTFLQDMTRAMLSTFDEDTILHTVLRGIKTDLGYEKAVIFMLDDKGMLAEKVDMGFPAHEQDFTFSMQDTEGLGRLLHKKFPVVHNGSLSELMTGFPPAGNGPGQSGQQAVVPIVLRDEVRGVIVLDRQAGEGPFSEERMGVLFTLAGQLGLAMDNASLYRDKVRLSITDGLTGLINARHFYERLDDEMSRASRYGHELTLFMLDIDFFKKYNDTYGHLSGDEALKAIAAILRQNSRESDTVARYGGEEFCVVLPETGQAEARILADRLRRAVEIMNIDPGSGHQPTNLTVSIGIASLTDDIQNPEEFVKAADKALYRAKQEGRNRVRADF